MSVATPRVPLSNRATSARWTTGGPDTRTIDMLPASTITAVATAPPRVPNHKRARSPDVERNDDDAHKRSRGSVAAPRDDRAAEERAQRLQRQQDREHYRNSYLKAFPNFVFYFDNVDPATKDRQTRTVASLGARVEQFFSRNATHVITSCPRSRIDALAAEAASNKENNPKKNQDASRSPVKAAVPSTSKPRLSELPENVLLTKAIGYGMKIWEATKLTSILESITHTHRNPRSATPSAQPTLEHLLASERRHGTHERDPTARRADWTYFPRNSHVLLVEDVTGVHATIATRDFGTKPVGGAKPGWPICHAHPDARGPFCEPPKGNKREQGQDRPRDRDPSGAMRRRANSFSHSRVQRRSLGGEAEPEREVEEDPDVEQAEYIAASGNSVAITSNVGTTSTAVAAPGIPRVRSTLRFQALAKGTGGASAMPPPKVIRKAKSTNTLSLRLPAREEKKKPGYCENCRARFEDFDQHVNGTKHRKFAVKDNNFRELDALLERIVRRPIEPVGFYEDDDSGHYDEDISQGYGLEEDVGDSSEDYGEVLTLGDDYVDRYHYPGMISGKGRFEADSDVIVVEPGDTQPEEDLEI